MPLSLSFFPVELTPLLTNGIQTNFLFQIFEVAPSLYMVELRKSGGDTLEFHNVCYCNVDAIMASNKYCIFI